MRVVFVYATCLDPNKWYQSFGLAPEGDFLFFGQNIFCPKNEFGVYRWKGLAPRIPKIFFSEFFDHRKTSESPVKRSSE